MRGAKASVPESTNNDVIDATREPANCPQFPDLRLITQAEQRRENVDDCLTLNIYTPNKAGQFPVIVFVHGEMLFDGSAAEGQPDYFLEHDVVLVTINYRLAPFGFLTTLTDDMPGNVALADIHMALEWVNQYIRPFGGNADQVTLIGQAGGATLVHALSLSDKALGLFHKLILQSGTALNPYFWDEDPLNTLKSFARLASCPVSNSDRNNTYLINCLQHMTTTNLLTTFKNHWERYEPYGTRITGGFKLVVGDRLGYITQSPAALVANNMYPVIMGVTKDAGAFILSRFYNQLEQLRSRNISDFINVVLKHTAQPRHHQLWKNLALQQIFTEEDIRNPKLYSIAQGLLELTNLILYRGPIIDSIRYTYRRYPTYLYCFDYRGEFHRFGHLPNPLPYEADATLSDDNIYLYPYPQEVSQLNAKDKQIATALVNMWVSFAEYNNPTPRNTNLWPNVTSDYGPFVRISNVNENSLELDYHFGEGIPTPNLYPEYFTTTTTSTTPRTTTTTTTQRTNPYYPNYEGYRPPLYNYPNSNDYSQNRRQDYEQPHNVPYDRNRFG
ncbi:glutactin-like [Teleopsis dalmanni]|uniref:glutactin-like n=1 Tax=Teleopsis dalmanni TaxID=139649 RepID=UPI0018CDA78D|nr:glutactin-like [Teleopsis dalmanni]